MGRLWGILKVNFRLSIQNNLLRAVLYLLIVPVLRSIKNLNEVYSAECLEQSVILIGILLIVPLHAAEHEAAIREAVSTRKVPQWMILFIRLMMAVLMLVFLTGIFAEIMIMNIHEKQLETHEVISGSGICVNDGAELSYEAGVISVFPAGVPHEVRAGEDGLYLFAKFMPALC